MSGDEWQRGSLTRRRVLVLGGTGLVAGAGSALVSAGPAEAHGEIQTFPGVDGQRTVYEGNGKLTSFGYRPSFHDRLDHWLRLWSGNVPAHWDRPMRIWTSGAHTDHRPSEAHNAGRGFDLTRIYTTSNGRFVRRFFARYDIWRNWSAANLNRARVLYWATSAMLNLCFENVLTYLYNSAHHNHIHIDNLVSGQSLSQFHPGHGPAQVQHVQACCRYLWGKSTRLDGAWGPQTRDHSTQVLRQIGRPTGTILTSPSNWIAFNLASFRRGVNRYP